MVTVLLVSDLHHTGYGTISKDMIQSMYSTHPDIKFSVLAINHDDDTLQAKISKDFPFLDNVFSVTPLRKLGLNLDNGEFAKNSLLGVYDLINISKTYQPDVLLAMNDNIMGVYQHIKWTFPKTKFICYMPIDSGDIPPGFFDNLRDFDTILTMNKFAEKELRNSFLQSPMGDYKGYISTLYPIMNKNYRPILNTLNIRKKWLSDRFNDYIILNINMNQTRKRLDLTLDAFSKFHELCPNSTLILKTKICTSDGIKNPFNYVDKHYPNIKSHIKIISNTLTENELNQLYNIANIFITTSMAEGWGFTPCEAASVGCKVLVPNHTSFIEIFNQFNMCYDSIPVVWLEKETPLNPSSLTTIAILTRKINKIRSLNELNKDHIKTNIPAIIISELGNDTFPQNPQIIGNTNILANFKTLEFTRSFLDSHLDSFKTHCLRIDIQIGNNCNFIKAQLKHLSPISPTQMYNPITNSPDFDIEQIYYSSLAGYYIKNYHPSVPDLVSRLIYDYTSLSGNYINKKVNTDLIKWFDNNCSSQQHADSLYNSIMHTI